MADDEWGLRVVIVVLGPGLVGLVVVEAQAARWDVDRQALETDVAHGDRIAEESDEVDGTRKRGNRHERRHIRSVLVTEHQSPSRKLRPGKERNRQGFQLYLAIETFADGVHQTLLDARRDHDGQRQQKQQDEGDAGDGGEAASGERHGASLAVFGPTRAGRRS
jgi:hypothetical protein